jgi:hypothetical protein
MMTNTVLFTQKQKIRNFKKSVAGKHIRYVMRDTWSKDERMDFAFNNSIKYGFVVTGLKQRFRVTALVKGSITTIDVVAIDEASATFKARNELGYEMRGEFLSCTKF